MKRILINLMAKDTKSPTLFKSEHQQLFQTLKKQKLPMSAGITVRILLLLLLAIVVGVMLTPWVQTSAGKGRVISLNPDERPQQLHALVDGRIKEWLVRDGQIVHKGDPIVRLVDNDPQLLDRLEAERNALKQKLELAGIAAETARLDYDRQDKLFKQGLASRREYEQAKIRLKEMLARVNDAQAGLNQSETKLTRFSTQDVVAPFTGMITNLRNSGIASFVKSGDHLADILPENHSPAVEIFVTGLDAPLLNPGDDARLMFEGWPSIQVSGWPSVAIGTFAGEVLSVDPAANINGLFRVLIIPRDNRLEGWPGQTFLRFGSKVQGWVLLDTVPLGFELWRQLNGFPPNNPELQSMLYDKPQK